MWRKLFCVVLLLFSLLIRLKWGSLSGYRDYYAVLFREEADANTTTRVESDTYADAASAHTWTDAEVLPKRKPMNLTAIFGKNYNTKFGKECSSFHTSDLQPAHTTTTTTKPTFVIHAGPSKTATTTLQRETKDMNRCVSGPLDNYKYIGFLEHGSNVSPKDSKFRRLISMRDTSKFRACFAELEQLKSNSQPYSNAECYKTMKQELDHYYVNHANIILSDEQMGWQRMFQKAYSRETYFEVLHELLADWNVLVVASFRRHAEWALSVFKEMNAAGCFGRNDPKRYKWPSQGGRKCELPWKTLSKWSSPTGNMVNETQTQKYRYVEDLYNAWSSHGFNTKVLNVHHPTQTIAETFFCDIVEDAPYTCQYTKNQKSDTVANAKSATTLFYDTIVVAAAEEPWGHNITQTPRGKVVQNLVAYHQTTLGLSVANLPLICPTQDELEQYLQLGLPLEKQLLPEFFASPLGEARHHSEFWKIANTKKSFCHVNTTALLENCNSWEDVKQRMAGITTW